MTHTIELKITDKQLKFFKKEVENLLEEATITDPLKMLTVMLQGEVANMANYVDLVFDGGGNGLGDVFNDKDIATFAVENFED